MLAGGSRAARSDEAFSWRGGTHRGHCTDCTTARVGRPKGRASQPKQGCLLSMYRASASWRPSRSCWSLMMSNQLCLGVKYLFPKLPQEHLPIPRLPAFPSSLTGTAFPNFPPTFAPTWQSQDERTACSRRRRALAAARWRGDTAWGRARRWGGAGPLTMALRAPIWSGGGRGSPSRERGRGAACGG